MNMYFKCSEKHITAIKAKKFPPNENSRKIRWFSRKRRCKMTPHVTLHYLVPSISLNEDFRWSICGSLAHFRRCARAHLYVYRRTREGFFRKRKKERYQARKLPPRKPFVNEGWSYPHSRTRSFELFL